VGKLLGHKMELVNISFSIVGPPCTFSVATRPTSSEIFPPRTFSHRTFPPPVFKDLGHFSLRYENRRKNEKTLKLHNSAIVNILNKYFVSGAERERERSKLLLIFNVKNVT